MNPEQFMAFREVARAGSISKAALKMHVSASSLSRAVKQLETELGVSLFDRNGRHLELNQYGVIALHHASFMDETLTNVVNDIRAAKERAGKVLRIYFRNSLGGTAAMLAPFIRMHPNDQLDIILSKNEALTEGYDLEFTSTMHDFEPNDSDFLLCDEGYCVVVSQNHALATRESVALSELCDESFITPPGDGGAFISRICRNAGFKPKHVLECPQVWTSIRAAAKGSGVLIAAELSMLAGFDEDIARIPLRDNIGTRHLRIRAREDFELTLLANELVEYMESYFKTMKERALK